MSLSILALYEVRVVLNCTIRPLTGIKAFSIALSINFSISLSTLSALTYADQERLPIWYIMVWVKRSREIGVGAEVLEVDGIKRDEVFLTSS